MKYFNDKNVLIWMLAALSASCSSSGLDKESFANPPQCARPSTYWEWMNGNISKKGITEDLEYMKNANYGGAMIFEAGVGIPKGNVDYNSSEWKDMIVHATKEADRLGMKLMMHNSPGYSGTGGPWISPEYSMKQLVWCDTVVETTGKVLEVSLPKGFSKLGFYKDAYILAYPALPEEKKSFFSLIKNVRLDNKVIDKNILFDNDLSTYIRIEKGQTLTLELNENFSSQSVTVFRGEREKPLDPHDGPRDNPPVLKFEASDNGTAYNLLGSLACPALREMDPPCTATYKNVTSRFYRVSSSRGTNIAEIDMHAYPCLNEYHNKINATNVPVKLTENSQRVEEKWVIDPEKVIDLTDKMSGDGHLTCELPSGLWNIVRIGYTSTGEEVAAAPDAGIGLDCDKFSKKALDVHFDKFVDPLLETIKPWCGNTFEALVIDSWEAGKQNWTEELPEYFKRARGYDIMPYLLAATGRIVSGVDDTERFLWDFRRTHSDMFIENYAEHFKERAARYGLKYAGEAYGDGNFESLEMASVQDYPMSEFWTHYIYGNITTTMMASSAAHIWGKSIVPCECYTGTPFNSKFTEHPYGMKALGDYIMCSGVNRFVYHATTHQPYTGAQNGNIMTMGPFGTHLDRNSTWADKFSALNMYNSRCAYVLQQGIHVADVLYLKDDAISSGVANYYQTNPKTPYGYKWDVATSDALMKRISVDNGRIVTPDGMGYSLMAVPSLHRTSPEVMEKLISLVNGGMNLLLYGEAPAGYLGLSHDKDKEVQELAKVLWKKQNLGKGRVFLDEEVSEVLEQLNVKPDFSFVSENMDALIHYTHRKVGDEDVYFVSNQRRRKEKICMDCRVNGKVPYLWNAESGENDLSLPYKVEGDRIKVNVDLAESGSAFVVFKKAASKGTDGYKDIKPVPSQVNTKNGVTSNDGIIDWNSTFSISCWCKPETFAASGRGFVLYPHSGNGKTAKVGFSMGQNGVFVYEHAFAKSLSLKYDAPVEGWTHVCIVYDEGVPHLYMNGKLVASGKKSGYACMPAIDEPMTDDQIILVFEGDNTPLSYYDYVLDEEEISRIYDKGLEPVRIEGEKIMDLSDDWSVYFPEWSHAPEKIQMPRLESLHKNDDFNVKHFSGTAVYKKTFNVSDEEYSRLSGKNIRLNLGRVENIAEVSLNGSDAVLLWKAPYETDVTGKIRNGENELVIKVTNLYPNRIIGDEALEEKYEYDEYGRIRELPDWYLNNEAETDRERVLFIPWKHYKATDPLLEAGLLGDVALYHI